MKILVERFKHNPEETIGKLYIDGVFQCFTLEDQHRDVKVKTDTRIPAGTYKLALRKVGGFHTRYAARFPGMHKGMLHVTNVPGFEFILIHLGNTEKDTAGCLLVGLHRQERTISGSEAAYKKIYPPIAAAIEIGQEVTIEYKDC